MKNKGLGEFEELVLLAVCILKGEAYGINVKQEVEKHKNEATDANVFLKLPLRACAN